MSPSMLYLGLKFLFVFIQITDASKNGSATNETNVKVLKFVHAIWRHGDRNPLSIYSTDKDNVESTWPEGFGELSIVGNGTYGLSGPQSIRQHYELGKFLRRRYKNFLPDTYDAKEIYVRSTGWNRTIMSALSNLAGMYPPKFDAFNEKIGWQPIPVHSQPKETETLLDMEFPCPAADKLTDMLFNSSSDVKKVLKENENFFKFLKNKTGFEKDIDLIHFYPVADPLICINSHNETHNLPSWVNQSVYDRVLNLMNIMTPFLYLTPEIQRFRGRTLFQEIASRMKSKSTKLNWPLKYYAYSAHDRSMIALMSNLGNYNGFVPPYASILLFEMYERQGEFYVEMFRQDGPSDDVHELAIPNCDPCTVDKFSSLAGRLKPHDLKKEC